MASSLSTPMMAIWSGIPIWILRQEILQERIGLTPDECRAIGHDNAVELIAR